MQRNEVSANHGDTVRSFSRPILYNTKLTSKTKETSWREYGRLFRDKLISEDENNGGLTFRLSQQVHIDRYFALAERILNQFLSNWQANQYLMTCPEERTELLDLYKQGNRLAKFVTTVMPTHNEYYSEDSDIKALRHESQEQVVTLLDYLEELAITIDQYEFNKHVLRNFQDDRGPPLESYFGTVGSDDDPSVQISQLDELDEDLTSSGTDAAEEWDPFRQTDTFFSSTCSHISLLEETQEPATPSCLKGVTKKPKRVTPTPQSKTKVSFLSAERERGCSPRQLLHSPQGEGTSKKWKTPSPGYKCTPNRALPYFLTSDEPVKNTPKSVADLSDWMSGDDTVSTVLSGDLSSSGHSSNSSRVSYYQLATEALKRSPRGSPSASGNNQNDELPLHAKEDELSLTNSILSKEEKQRQKKSHVFKACVKCLTD